MLGKFIGLNERRFFSIKLMGDWGLKGKRLKLLFKMEIMVEDASG